MHSTLRRRAQTPVLKLSLNAGYQFPANGKFRGETMSEGSDSRAGRTSRLATVRRACMWLGELGRRGLKKQMGRWLSVSVKRWSDRGQRLQGPRNDDRFQRSTEELCVNVNNKERGGDETGRTERQRSSPSAPQMKGAEADGQRVPGGAGCRAYKYYLPPAAPETTTPDSGTRDPKSRSASRGLQLGRGWINQWPLPAWPWVM